jgi:hypothetical protein
MNGLFKIYGNKNLLAIVIRKNYKVDYGIHFLTSPSDSLQLAMHNYKSSKTTNIHSNDLKNPLEINRKQKYLYITKGSAVVKLLNKKEKIIKRIILKASEAIIIRDVLHQVVFSKNSKAIEIKQGPYI